MSSAILTIANITTGSRYLFGVLLVLGFSYEYFSPNILPLIAAAGIVISDIIDGLIARKLGSVSSAMEGMVFDLMADDFAIVTSSICLFWKGLIPVWLMFLVVWTRCLMTSIRMLTLAQKAPFASSRKSTKTKGLIYGIGLLTLVSLDIFKNIITPAVFTNIERYTLLILTASTAIAFVDFHYINRHIIFKLFSQPK